MAAKLNEINRTELTELTEAQRKAAINEAYGEPVYDFLVELNGDTISRATAVVNYEHDEVNDVARASLIGDCGCGGSSCREGWGWIWDARDLNMLGHRGSLKVRPCDKVVCVFNAETGELEPLAPFGMNPDEFYRFERAEWGDVSSEDAQNLSAFNLAISEGKNNSWTPDKKGDA